MRKTLTSIALAFILCAMTGVVAMAKEKSRVVTFGSDFVVGATEVKAGTYRVSFNDQTNEVSILDRKTKAVIAKATARLEKREGNSNIMDIRWATKGSSQVLIGITFPGDSQNIVVNDGTQVANN
ncbi:MAG: hypothetical protein H7Y30_00780 [Pyrinomonadaceae bacterium]|nr:hypothetical protein [Pyrinomonadaceae bacterium]